jgi:Protein of unknown function (DUF3237)
MASSGAVKRSMMGWTEVNWVKADACIWISSPTFETSSANYSWLNSVVAVGQMSEIKAGDGAHIKYEVYSVK